MTTDPSSDVVERLCATCGERPRHGSYSNCSECLTEEQVAQIVFQREQRRQRGALKGLRDD